MSQKKVDKYKEYKKNKKQILEQEKKKLKLEKGALTLAAVIIIAIICGGLGFSGYNSYKARLAARPNYDREEMVIGDLSSILAETAQETEASQAAE